MAINYGFTSVMTARPGLGDDVVALLRRGLEPGKPAASEYCLFYVISRSESNPDVVQIAEGWTSEEDHHREFAGEAAQAIAAGFAELLAGEAVYTDLVPLGGKAVLPD